MNTPAAVKKILYVQRRAPHGTIHGLEGLEVALIGAAFEQQVTMAFVDDGVYQLISGQDTRELGSRNYSATFGALGDYDVGAMLVEQASMELRGLKQSDLVRVWSDPEADEGDAVNLVQVVDSDAMRRVIEQSDAILSF